MCVKTNKIWYDNKDLFKCQNQKKLQQQNETTSDLRQFEVEMLFQVDDWLKVHGIQEAEKSSVAIQSVIK